MSTAVMLPSEKAIGVLLPIARWGTSLCLYPSSHLSAPRRVHEPMAFRHSILNLRLKDSRGMSVGLPGD